MTLKFEIVRRGAVLALALMIWSPSARAVAKPAVTTDIAGTYSLTKRVMVDGTTIASPQNTRQYCEWMLFTTRDNLDGPGFTHEPPPVENHCSPITRRAGRLEYAPAGEGVTVSFGPEGFTASIAGQFTDHWARVR